MKNILVLLVAVMTLVSCKDTFGPTITLPIDSFCVKAGGEIMLIVDIAEENTLKEVNLLAPDLNFAENIPGNIIEEAGGTFEAVFTIDEATIPREYIMTVQAVDEFDNESNQNIMIKVTP